MTAAPTPLTAESSAIRTAFRRLVPWCTLIYVVSYIDRVNVGFAALSMNKDLGLSATAFGVANTVLFIMYTACEVPSSMLLVRYGIRRWLPGIMIAWGFASTATMLAADAYSLYGLRALVGITEAGLLPGLLFFLSRWFPVAHRAKANALFLCALPLALVIGGPVSGAVMGLDGVMGLAGWRWLFLLEGIPAIVAGICAYLWLPEVPAQARWLSEAESRALQQRLDQERLQAVPNAENYAASGRSWRDIVTLPVVVLAVSYFCVIATANTLGIWTPQIVHELMGGGSPLMIGLLTAVPPLFAVVGMQVVSWNSDRTKDRVGHLLGVMAAAALGWALVVLLQAPALKLAALALSTFGGYAAMAIFWTVSTQYIAHRSHAVGIAAIQSVGNLASIVSPLIIGMLRDSTHDFYAGIWYAAGLMTAGMVLVAVVTAWVKPRRQVAASPA